ncbi:MAG TPA: c(7)-type cytochrome triheme domain-containing protein [Noviherbaspirillum sp.]
MFTFRRLSAFLVASLLVISVQNGAHSQLRPVPIPLPVEAPSAAPDPDELEGTVDTGFQPNKFYDPRNPDHETLQKGDDARAKLPLDKRGAVDWMTALRNGAITPRSDLSGNKPNEVLHLDVILKNTKEMPYVKFPHNSHTEWLACSNCHDSLFVPKAGANQITMEKIFRGEFCGVCHDRVAFVTHSSCERCHSVPHANSRQWW